MEIGPQQHQIPGGNKTDSWFVQPEDGERHAECYHGPLHRRRVGVAESQQGVSAAEGILEGTPVLQSDVKALGPNEISASGTNAKY